MLFYPTAIGWHPSEKAEYGAAQLDAWRTIQRAHAIANGVYVAAVNRVGHEGAGRAAASSSGARRFVCDPFGRSLAEASTTRTPRSWSSSATSARLETVRRHWPFLRDRRIDAYGPIVERLLDSR